METYVCEDDLCFCSQGSSPCHFIVTSQGKFTIQGRKVATESDSSLSNLPSFGMCRTMGNPSVEAATAVAQGVLTPMPCVPVYMGKWQTGIKKTVAFGGKCIGKNAVLKCQYSGVIKVQNTGQNKALSN